MSRKFLLSLVSVTLIGTVVMVNHQGNFSSLRSDFNGELVEIEAIVLCADEQKVLNTLTQELTKTQSEYALLSPKKATLQARKKVLEIKNTKDKNYSHSIAYLTAAIAAQEKVIKTAMKTKGSVKEAKDKLTDLVHEKNTLVDELIQIIGDLEKVNNFFPSVTTLAAKIAQAGEALSICEAE